MTVKVKKTPKYYEYKIEWVEITPKMKKQYLSKPITYPDQIKIGKSINYSAESIRKVFIGQPDKVNKILWDAIVNFRNGSL